MPHQTEDGTDPESMADSPEADSREPQYPHPPEAAGDEALELPPETFALEPEPVAPQEPERKRPDAKLNDKLKQKPRQPAPQEASQSPFSVTVQEVYDGPLDLLLDLIRKQNIDVYDIPIALITAQFLDYCHGLKQTDVDSAGEFIYMASLLIHIKSKTLLPRDPSDVSGADPEDPRRELVARLLEHERFKAAAQMLLQKQQVEEATWTNPGLRTFLREQAAASSEGSMPEMEGEIAVDLIEVTRAFSDILARMRERPVLDVNEESVTVAGMIDYLKRRLLMEDKPIILRRLLHSTHTERALICTFLAMLELVRLQAILLFQANQLGDILVKKADGFDTVFADGTQSRDDWL